MLTVGTVLQQRYEIVRAIGQGGVGAVYEAKALNLKSRVAIKQLLFDDAQIIQAFQREAHMLGNLRHPSIPRILDHFADTAGHFLVMDYIPGPDLDAQLRQRGGPFLPQEVLGWADQLLASLAYLHGQTPPILHRDIKPSNIKVLPDGTLMLLDFGLAKGSVATTQLTQATSVRGYTPLYSPFEQIQGTGTSERSDLYALAATLYHLLVGKPAPDALTRAAAVLNGQPDPLVPPQKLNPAIPQHVGDVLVQALSIPAQARPAGAQDLRAALKGQPDTGQTHVSPAPPASAVPPTILLSQPGDADQPTVVSPPAPISAHDQPTVVSPPASAHDQPTVVNPRPALAGASGAADQPTVVSPPAPASSHDQPTVVNPPAPISAHDQPTVVSPPASAHDQPTVVSPPASAHDQPTVVNPRPAPAGSHRRRNLFFAIGLVGVLLVMAAVMRNRGVAPANVAGEITVWGWQSSIDMIRNNGVLADFEAEYPNVKVTLVQQEIPTLYQSLPQTLSASSGGPDVVLVEDSQLGSLIELGGLMDLTEHVEPYVDEINDHKWLGATKDGKYYAMPWDSGPVVLFYRRDVFRAAGLPDDPEGFSAAVATWDRYLEVCKTIRARTGSACFALSKAQNTARLYEMMLWQQGLGYYNEAGEITIDSPQNVATLEKLAQFWKAGVTSDQLELTDPWYAELAAPDRPVATIVKASWLGLFLKTRATSDTAGKWGWRACRRWRRASRARPTMAAPPL